MKEYIFGERNGIYIIDLQKTQRMFRDAIAFVTNAIAEDRGKTVLFVGTKRQAQDAVREEAERCSQYYVNQRWLGGLLTNFQTVQKSIKRLKDLEAMQTDGRYEKLTKKERIKLDREREGLNKNLSGIKSMARLPDMVFIIDVRKEEIAVAEANRLGIPIVAVVDTNCSPEGIDYVIPGNDDALRAVRLFASRISDAILEGQQIATEGGVVAQTDEGVEIAEGAPVSEAAAAPMAEEPSQAAEPVDAGANVEPAVEPTTAPPPAESVEPSSSESENADKSAESVVAAS
jgi:small subunit ribosomal protein S2